MRQAVNPNAAFERHGVSNHLKLNNLCNSFIRCITKKLQKSTSLTLVSGNTRDRGIHSQRASDAYFYVMTSYWLTGITQSWCACSVLLLRLSFILFLQFYMYSCVACTVLIPKVTKVGDNKTKTTILPYDISYRLVKGCGISIASTLAYYRLALSHGQSSFDSKCMAISHSTVNYRYIRVVQHTASFITVTS